MSTLPELADRLEKMTKQMEQCGLVPSCIGEYRAIDAELRQQPHPVNAELLTAAKSRLLSCADGGDCADAALMVGEFCSNECSALSRAIASAESVEKEPAPVNQQMLDALRYARAFIGEEEPIITKRLDDAIVRAESVEKAPDALTLSHEIQAKRGFSMGAAESAPAQPDVVSGLLDALRDIAKSRHLDFAQGRAMDALNAFEVQSKAEPKA